eukprot:TRINITY_DN88_c2_g3_i2.p1 TRINITY_DN88_c2_g3~~TRINITY_DN88_c2_g3_i2.p1  ORF type:complete len:644 (+),score=137.38 TRINITY_DN88_c2_g3_i2:153-2084(+)
MAEWVNAVQNWIKLQASGQQPPQQTQPAAPGYSGFDASVGNGTGFPASDYQHQGYSGFQPQHTEFQQQSVPVEPPGFGAFQAPAPPGFDQQQSLNHFNQANDIQNFQASQNFMANQFGGPPGNQAQFGAPGPSSDQHHYQQPPPPQPFPEPVQPYQQPPGYYQQQHPPQQHHQQQPPPGGYIPLPQAPTNQMVIYDENFFYEQAVQQRQQQQQQQQFHHHQPQFGNAGWDAPYQQHPSYHNEPPYRGAPPPADDYAHDQSAQSKKLLPSWLRDAILKKEQSDEKPKPTAGGLPMDTPFYAGKALVKPEPKAKALDASKIMKEDDDSGSSSESDAEGTYAIPVDAEAERLRQEREEMLARETKQILTRILLHVTDEGIKHIADTCLKDAKKNLKPKIAPAAKAKTKVTVADQNLLADSLGGYASDDDAGSHSDADAKDRASPGPAIPPPPKPVAASNPEPPIASPQPARKQRSPSPPASPAPETRQSSDSVAPAKSSATAESPKTAKAADAKPATGAGGWREALKRAKEEGGKDDKNEDDNKDEASASGDNSDDNADRERTKKKSDDLLSKELDRWQVRASSCVAPHWHPAERVHIKLRLLSAKVCSSCKPQFLQSFGNCAICAIQIATRVDLAFVRSMTSWQI